MVDRSRDSNYDTDAQQDVVDGANDDPGNNRSSLINVFGSTESKRIEQPRIAQTAATSPMSTQNQANGVMCNPHLMPSAAGGPTPQLQINAPNTSNLSPYQLIDQALLQTRGELYSPGLQLPPSLARLPFHRVADIQRLIAQGRFDDVVQQMFNKPTLSANQPSSSTATALLQTGGELYSPGLQLPPSLARLPFHRVADIQQITQANQDHLVQVYQRNAAQQQFNMPTLSANQPSSSTATAAGTAGNNNGRYGSRICHISFPKEIPDLSDSARFSSKVFFGGLPYNLTNNEMGNYFGQYGLQGIEHKKGWKPTPYKANDGHVYLIFDSPKKVKSVLLSNLVKRVGVQFLVESPYPTWKKDCEIIPWNTDNSLYTSEYISEVPTEDTMFVGGLPGRLTAEQIARVMEREFNGKVKYCHLDLDQYDYPTGTGRVTFTDPEKYKSAVSASGDFYTDSVTIQTVEFTKRVQIDPFLTDDATCSICGQPGALFCRQNVCFRYFCGRCWNQHHMYLPEHRQMKLVKKRSR